MDIGDWLEIQQLLARMAPAYDEGDADTLARCYTEDGVLDGWGFRAEGRAALRARVIETFSQRPPHRHHLTNVLIEPDPRDPDRARARSCWLYTVTTGEVTEIGSTGTYEDDLVKDDGVWRVARRTVQHDSGRSSVT